MVKYMLNLTLTFKRMIMEKVLSTKGYLIVTMISFFLVACGGSGGNSETPTPEPTPVPTPEPTPVPDPEPTPVPAPEPTSVNITGTISYQRVLFSETGNGLDYDNIETLPVRGATLLALDVNGDTLDSTTTSETGTYSVTVDQDTSVSIVVYAQTISTDTAKWDFEVRDNTNENSLYGLLGELTNTGTSADSVRNLTASTTWDAGSYTSRVGAPFAILDSAYDVVQKIVTVDPDVELTGSDIFWSENNTTVSGDNAVGEIGTSHYSNKELYILGKEGVDTDEFDDHVIIHELGHYFEDNLSRADSIGGSHGSGDVLDMRVAFGEGFGNAFSGMITDDPIYRDSLNINQSSEFQFNVDENINANPGWYSEFSVQAILYDLYDGDVDADGSDNIELGFSGIYNVLTSSDYINQPSMTSIFSFIDEVQTQNSTLVTDINAVVTAQDSSSDTTLGIDVVKDKYGTNETHSAHIPNNLPVYKTLKDDGTDVFVCSHVLAQETNGLGVRQFLRFTPSAAGNFTITANFVDIGTADPENLIAGDPDFYLYLNGDIAEGINGASAGTGGSIVTDQEVIAVSLQNEEYILEVFHYGNIDGNSTNSGTACFNITATNS